MLCQAQTCPYCSDSAYSQPTNPFDQGDGWQCTRYAWGRAYQVTGANINARHNAGSWFAQTTNYPKDQTAAPNSVAVWCDTATCDAAGDGHVAYVESVGPSGIVISEMNFNNQASSRNTAQDWDSKTLSTTQMQNYLGLHTLQGYIHLQASTDPDITSLASQTLPVGWYFFTGPSGRWYIANTGGDVLALEAPPNYPASGTLPWKPISNYVSYAGYPAAGVNYSYVQIASNGNSVSFGSLKGGGGDTEVSQLANTTQPVKWMYFQDSRSIWYIFDSYSGSQAVMRLMGYDSSVNGGVLWKPINNYPAYVGYPAAGIVYQYVYTSTDGRSIIFGPLN